VSCQAAFEQGLHPRQISFTATKQALVEAWKEMGVAGDSTSVFSRFFLNRGVFSGIIGSRRS
jgi:hypothetical protein